MWLVAHRHSRHPCAAVLAAVLLCTAGGCVFTRDAVSPLNAEAPAGGKTHEVTRRPNPPKDGSVVLSPQGFAIGKASCAAPARSTTSPARRILVDGAPDQVAVEVYSREMRPVASGRRAVGGPILVAVWRWAARYSSS
jgi:hypothetical protein